MARPFPVVAGTLVALSCLCCAEPETAVLWTSRPEFVLYAQRYNVEQDRYHIEVRYVDAPLQMLEKPGRKPDMMVAGALQHENERKFFADLSPLFKQKTVNPDTFYPALLRYGQTGSKQYLLPVSFNLPAIIFAQSPAEPLAFVTDIDAIRQKGIAYNQLSGGLWARLGFSPLWDDGGNVLVYLIARLFGVDFHENASQGIIWNEDALNDALTYINDWIEKSTGSVRAEDDFIYQYFFDPPYKLLADGRILFAYKESDNLFKLQNEELAGLDFRWLSHNDMIPVSENVVSFGIYKRAKAKKAAADFAHWFFDEQTQDSLLKQKHKYHLKGTVFGIAGGFSAMQTVTELVLPKYYTNLLGHTPPASMLEAPVVLPTGWQKIKEDVIYPYMLSQIKDSQDAKRNLHERLANWQMIKQKEF